MLFTLVASSDLGRLDYLTMNQQALMECVVAGLNEKPCKSFCDRKGNFKDIKKWKGVKCDSEENVIEIFFSFYTTGCETLSLRWLPPTVRELDIRAPLRLTEFTLPQSVQRVCLQQVNLQEDLCFDALPPQIKEIKILNSFLQGRIALAAIPESLHRIHIVSHQLQEVDMKCSAKGLADLAVTNGQLEGTLDFHLSPASLKDLNLERNRLSGPLRFVGLSETLQNLNLSFNSFQGTLRFDDLPLSLLQLKLNGHSFTAVFLGVSLPSDLSQIDFTGKKNAEEISGRVDFLYFNTSVDTIWMSHNRLQGTLRLSHLTELIKLEAAHNQLEGSIETSELPGKLSHLELTVNKLTGSVDLTTLPQDLQFLCLGANALSGTINLSKLPPSLRQLGLSDNQLSGSFHIENAKHNMFFALANNQFDMLTLVVHYEGDPYWNTPMVDISGNGVQKVVDDKGKRIPTSRVTLWRSRR